MESLERVVAALCGLAVIYIVIHALHFIAR